MALPRFTRTSPIAGALAGLSVLVLGGCQSATPPTTPGLFGPTRASGAGLAMTDAWAFVLGVGEDQSRSRTFEIVAGESSGHERRLDVRTEDGEIVVTSTIVGEEHPESVDRWTVSADGSLVALRSMTRDHEVITGFDPPLLVFPKRLEPGAPATMSNEFIVHPVAHPSRVKQRGKATLSITLVGIEEVTLGSGSIDALHVRSELKIDFGVAAVDRVTDQWFAVGKGEERDGIGGIIAERYDETIKVLGIQTERHAGTMRLSELPGVSREKKGHE